MALSLTGISSGSSPIKAEHITQFFNLLTGQMTDQAVTLKNTLTVGSNQGTADPLLTLHGVTSMTAALMRLFKVNTDTQPVLAVDVNGKLSWGPGGSSAADTTLERIAATILGINGALRMDQVGTPSAPGASKSILYFKSDGIPYYRSGAAGAETSLAANNITDPLVAQVFA